MIGLRQVVNVNRIYMGVGLLYMKEEAYFTHTHDMNYLYLTVPHFSCVLHRIGMSGTFK